MQLIYSKCFLVGINIWDCDIRFLVFDVGGVGLMLDLDRFFSFESKILYFRIVLFTGFLAYPLFGFVYRSYMAFSDPLPFSYRWVSSLFFLVLFVSTFFSNFIREKINDVLYFAVGFAFLQLVYFAFINDYSLNFALSVLIVIMILNFLFDGDFKLKYFNLFMVVSVFSSLLLASSIVDRFFYGSSVLFVVLISYYISRARYKSRKKFESLFQYSPAGLVRCNGKGKILDVNETFIDISGVESEDELVGLNVFDLLKLEGLDEDKLVSEGLDLPSVKKVEFPSGKESWIGFTFEPVDLKSDSETGFILAIQDVSRRKKAQEMEKLLHDLLRHDVRNKIQVAYGYQELLNEYDLPEEIEDYVKKSLNALEDGKNLINKVRTLMKLEESEKVEEIEINQIIKDSLSDMKERANEKGIEINYEEISCKVLGGILLKELFDNLLENSLDHSGCETVKISGRTSENKCIITVEDDGKGISDDKKEKIFEKGFKDSKTGGSGLGMYLVHEIISLYDGKIEVLDSEMGGVRFNVYLKRIG